MFPKNTILFYLTVFLSIQSFFFQITAQESVVDKDIIIKLAPSPENPELYVARYYDLETERLLEYWTLKSSVAKVNASNFNQLKKEGKIWPYGKHYTFYPNIKPKLEIDFGNGIGLVKGYYETGEVKFEGKYNGSITGDLKHYHRNGELLKKEKMVFGLPEGKVEQFDDDGNLQQKATYKNGALNGNYFSYFSYKTLKRKAKFEMDKLVFQECFDELGNKIAETPFFERAGWPFNINYLNFELEKINFNFNTPNNDTAICRFTVRIDRDGNSQIGKIDFEETSKLKPELMKWLNESPGLVPAVYDGIPGNSMLNIAFSVSGNNILWFGEPVIFDKRFRDFTTQEDMMVTYIEYPLQEIYECVETFDEEPQFPEGGQALQNFLASNLVYPQDAINQNISGKVLVSFVVAPTGNIADISILKSVHPLLDSEAYRVVSIMPKWKPATCNGKPVPVSYGVPINFKTTKSKRRHLETVKTLHVY